MKLIAPREVIRYLLMASGTLLVGGGIGYLCNYPSTSYKIKDISPFWSAQNMENGKGLELVKALVQRHKINASAHGKWVWDKSQLDPGLKQIRHLIKGAKDSKQSKQVRSANNEEDVKKISGLSNIFEDMKGYCREKDESNVQIRDSSTLSGYLQFCWQTDSEDSSSDDLE